MILVLGVSVRAGLEFCWLNGEVTLARGSALPHMHKSLFPYSSMQSRGSQKLRT
jgi:hypothetical protein